MSDDFSYKDSESNNLIFNDSFYSQSIFGDNSNNFSFLDNFENPEIQIDFEKFKAIKNDKVFSNDEISNENIYIGKKRKDSEVSKNKSILMPLPSKETRENSPEENLPIDMVKDHFYGINSKDNNLKSKNGKKMIFKVNRDLSIEEILRKYRPPNSHILDYFFKYFKKEFVHYFTNKINLSIYKCKFKKKIDNVSIPNYESFQGHSNYSDNKKFLKYKMEEIYTNIEFIKKYKGGYQINNQNIFFKIKNTECENKKEYDYLISLLNLTLEEAYKLFYDDQMAFFEFEKNEKTRYYDFYFPKNYGYSLLQKYKIIDFINNNKNK